jgi:hypothetical protein
MGIVYLENPLIAIEISSRGYAQIHVQKAKMGTGTFL